MCECVLWDRVTGSCSLPEFKETELLPLVGPTLHILLVKATASIQNH